KIQRPLKTQRENRRLDEEPQGSRTGCLFLTAFRPCSIHKIQRLWKAHSKNSKTELSLQSPEQHIRND
ncbi:hypothetical protein DDV23_10790, partial [Streptococcus chenjunshii]